MKDCSSWACHWSTECSGAPIWSRHSHPTDKQTGGGGGGETHPQTRTETNAQTEVPLCHGERVGRKVQELSHTMEDLEVFLDLTSEVESNPDICDPFCSFLDEDRSEPGTALCPGVHREQDPKRRGRSCSYRPSRR